MTMLRTALALAAATALSAATLQAHAQTDTEAMQMETTGALGEVSDVFLTADDLDEIEVIGVNGEEIGEIENVVVDAEGTHYVVVDVGGFLDIGDEPVAIPMERLAASGDENLVLTGMTADELEELAELTDEMMEGEGTRVLGADDEIEIRMLQ